MLLDLNDKCLLVSWDDLILTKLERLKEFLERDLGAELKPSRVSLICWRVSIYNQMIVFFWVDESEFALILLLVSVVAGLVSGLHGAESLWTWKRGLSIYWVMTEILILYTGELGLIIFYTKKLGSWWLF